MSYYKISYLLAGPERSPLLIVDRTYMGDLRARSIYQRHNKSRPLALSPCRTRLSDATPPAPPASACMHACMYLLYHHQAQRDCCNRHDRHTATAPLSQTFELEQPLCSSHLVDSMQSVAQHAKVNRHRAKGARSAPGRALRAQPRGRRAG